MGAGVNRDRDNTSPRNFMECLHCKLRKSLVFDSASSPAIFRRSLGRRIGRS